MIHFRDSFLQEVYSVARIVKGSDRAEAALWFLMDRIKATEIEKINLAGIFMGQDDVEENT